MDPPSKTPPKQSSTPCDWPRNVRLTWASRARSDVENAARMFWTTSPIPAESTPAMLGENHVSHTRHLSVLRWILVFPILPQYLGNVVVGILRTCGVSFVINGLESRYQGRTFGGYVGVSVFDGEGGVMSKQFLFYNMQLLEFFLFVRRLLCRVLNKGSWG